MVNTEYWVKLHRRIMNDPLWEDKPFNKACAWIDLILLANYKDGEAKDGRQVKRGECVTSIRWLADRWGWGRKKVSGFLEDMEKDGYIELKTEGAKKGAKKGAIIRLVKYGFYQDSGANIRTKKGDYRKKLRQTDDVSPTDITHQEEKINIVRGMDESKKIWEDLL